MAIGMAAEDWGTWSGGNDNDVVFSVPLQLRSRDVKLHIRGFAYANRMGADPPDVCEC